LTCGQRFFITEVEFLKLDTSLAQQSKRPALEGVVAAARHPQHASAMQKLPLPATFVFHPQLEGAGGKFGVGLAGAVGAAHDAGFATRRRA
jgi:hypothetical protein